METQLKEAYAHCQKQAFGHYENFPVASVLLPASIRPHIAAVYAFARIADDFADEQQDSERALSQLKDWGQQLEDCVEGKATNPVFVALNHTIQSYDLPLQLFRDLLTAFTRDVTVKRYRDWDDLLGNYCRYSANPVGRLVLLISGYREEALHQLSDCICSALQLTNFWQDVKVDLEKGRIYVPQALMEKHGVTEASLLKNQADQKFKSMMREASSFTEGLFQKGAALPEQVQGCLRWELKATWLGGAAILKKVGELQYNTLHTRPTLNLADKLMIGFQAFLPKQLVSN